MRDKPFGKDMADAYQDRFRYSDDLTFDWRLLESDSSWYQKIKDNINANRPLQYCYASLDVAHSLVLDGWQEVGGTFKGHMNDGENNGWVDMSDLPGTEGMIREIHPDCTVGPLLNGRNVGLPGVNYAYFDQDAIGLPALTVEYIGYSCQFLPRATLRTWPPVPASASVGSSVQFEGSLTGMSLFSIKGTSAASIKISPNGVLTLRDGGCVRFF